MSAFGDNTPRQDLLDSIEYEMKIHNLSWRKVLYLLMSVMAYIAEYYVED